MLWHDGMEIIIKKEQAKVKCRFEFGKTFSRQCWTWVIHPSQPLLCLTWKWLRVSHPLHNHFIQHSHVHICDLCHAKKWWGPREWGWGSMTEPISSQDDAHSNVGVGHTDGVVERRYSLYRSMIILLYVFIIYLI